MTEGPTVTPTRAWVDQNLPESDRQGIALAMSGGGTRAALFHLGGLRRLNELGVLSRVDEISSVSGGSILAAHVATVLRPWPVPGTAFPDFEGRVAGPFEQFCSLNLRTAPVARRLLPWNWLRHSTQIDALVKCLETHLGRSMLRDLPDEGPVFTFCASDNAFGVNWIMRRNDMGSYRAGYAATPRNWTVARAAAASSCFPPIFDPMSVDLEPAVFAGGDFDGPRDEYERLIRGLRLSDGGLYDNLALEPVWKSRQVVIASDGGATFDAEPDTGLVWRLKRYSTILGRQATAVRKRWLISNFIAGIMQGTYFGIGTLVQDYETGTPSYPAELVRRYISQVRTDLDAFSPAEMQILQNHGYLLAEAATRRYLRPVVSVSDAALQIPYPEAMNEDFVKSALTGSAKRRLPFGRGRWLQHLSH